MVLYCVISQNMVLLWDFTATGRWIMSRIVIVISLFIVEEETKQLADSGDKLFFTVTAVCISNPTQCEDNFQDQCKATS
jgi:hypothetical protein